MDEPPIGERKKALRAKRRAERKEWKVNRKSERKRERQCFWTWPLGHEYQWSNYAQSTLCVGCDKPLRGPL